MKLLQYFHHHVIYFLVKMHAIYKYFFDFVIDSKVTAILMNWWILLCDGVVKGSVWVQSEKQACLIIFCDDPVWEIQLIKLLFPLFSKLCVHGLKSKINVVGLLWFKCLDKGQCEV